MIFISIAHSINCHFSCLKRTYNQIQLMYNTITSYSLTIYISLLIFWTCNTIPFICFTIAYFLNNRLFLYNIYWFNRQMKCYYTIASIGSSEGLVVITASSICCSIPLEWTTGYSNRITRLGLVDGQVQCYYTIATINIDKCIGIVATSSISFSIPCKLFTRNCCSITNCWLVDGQMQSHSTIAAINVS